MSDFDVELVGGPFPGSRSLRTPRAEPPHQIPIVRKDQAATADGATRRRVAIYRFSTRRPDGQYVYQYAGERPPRASRA